MDVITARASESLTAGAPLNTHSCLLCRQRKIKCDKRQPCFNCIRGQKQCIYSAPEPPRRRKGRIKLSEDELLRRLRSYETLLKSYVARSEELEGHGSGSQEPEKSKVARNGLLVHDPPSSSDLEKSSSQVAFLGYHVQ